VNIKIFTGATISEAKHKVEKEFGKDAFIFNIRTIKKWGILNFFAMGKSTVEIVAGKSEEPEEQETTPIVSLPLKRNQITQPVQAVSAPPPAEEPRREVVQYGELMKEIKLIGERVKRMEIEREKPPATVTTVEVEPLQTVSDELQPFFDALTVQGLNQVFVQDILDSMEQEFSEETQAGKGPRKFVEIRERVKKKLADKVVIGPEVEKIEDGRQKIVAFIGPTGVGKTTTLVKLACDLSIREGRSVGIITFDMFRIGAPEQLEQYCKIMYLPFEVVYTPAELVLAVERFKDKEVIFIDSAGRSQKNRSSMSELKRFLVDEVGIESYLVISGTTKYEDMKDIVKKFRTVAFNSIIVTKLDETNTIGPVFRLLQETGLPVSYFTTGQNVPGDIEQADALSFAGRVVKKAKLPTARKTRRKIRQRQDLQQKFLVQEAEVEHEVDDSVRAQDSVYTQDSVRKQDSVRTQDSVSKQGLADQSGTVSSESDSNFQPLLTPAVGEDEQQTFQASEVEEHNTL